MPVVEQVDLEAPRAGEILIRIVASGICHTDLGVHAGAGVRGRRCRQYWDMRVPAWWCRNGRRRHGVCTRRSCGPERVFLWGVSQLPAQLSQLLP